MRITNTVVIGAGQAGLAASRCLADRRRDHVVLERGRIGQRWRGDTWDSLHLLTPNWMNTLPGEAYRGPDPNGFSSAAAFGGHLTQYADSFGASVEEHSAVRLLRKRDHGFEVGTDRAAWLAANVIIATGWCDRPAVPAAARALPADIHQVVPNEYRNPCSLPDGGVLVVGASATGAQLADELRAAGRDVTIAVGRHTRMPRNYRGMDIYWWLDRLGLLDTTIDEMPDRLLARHEPSAQVVGRPDHRRLDLATLQANGVRLAGRVLAIDGHRVRLARQTATSGTSAPTPPLVSSRPTTARPACSPARRHGASAEAASRRSPRSSRSPLPTSQADSLPPCRRAHCARSPGGPATCADHGDQAGPSSAMQATSRIHSLRTG